ncbi:hypothetical protein B296_00035806 [Ensete ventricosum]|uniref:Lipocalin/cytosolic fatty-acid binding domain-containing protein n=1 Tax=Ensete ventricosum TaxID=4639 RepID=A0A426YBI2_ENSVE|nr:hypothetical protein B296_00035806 [Ensete ventricosum]
MAGHNVSSDQVVAAEPSHHGSLSQIAAAIDSGPASVLDEMPDERSVNVMMMRGMTAKNFDPVRYSGRWFEVASLKRGFAGQGQEDCHCTQEPYDVIATDYDNFSLVSGAKDTSFIQIKDTPQDCEVMSNSQLALMMSMSGMKAALTNQFPELELKAPVALNPFTSVFDTLKKLIELYLSNLKS